MATRLGGRYIEVRELGAGAMGRVVQAVDTETGRSVAAKIMLGAGEDNLEALLRFQQEGTVLSTLKHPNIVRVYSTFLEEQNCYIIMELLEGESLGQILRRDRLSLARTKSIAAQVASALAYAHVRSIVHRDIKPDNIMVVGDDHVKVTDFGIARILRFNDVLLTRVGMTIGTPLYMAPEQIEEGQTIDARTDIYALGAVLYEMVSGSPPFPGTNPLTVAFNHLHTPPRAPSHSSPDLPDDWDSLILKMLAKDPADRYQSASALEEAIAGLSEGEAPLTEAPASEDVRSPVIDAPIVKNDVASQPGPSVVHNDQAWVDSRVIPPGTPGTPEIEPVIRTPADTQSGDLPPAAVEDVPSGLSSTLPPTPAPAQRVEPIAGSTIAAEPSDRGTIQGQSVPERMTISAPAAENTPTPAPTTYNEPTPTNGADSHGLGLRDTAREIPVQRATAAAPSVESVTTTREKSRRRPLLFLVPVAGVILAIALGALALARSLGTTATVKPQPTPVTVRLSSLPRAGSTIASGSRVTLSWATVPHESRYDVQEAIYRSPVPQSRIFSTGARLLVVTHAGYASTVLGAQHYYWRVRGLVSGHWTGWSSPLHFSVSAPITHTPTLRSPANGSRNAGAHITVCWSTVQKATGYRLRVDRTTSSVKSPCRTLQLPLGRHIWSVAAQMRGARIYTSAFSSSHVFTLYRRQKPHPKNVAAHKPPNTTSQNTVNPTAQPQSSPPQPVNPTAQPVNPNPQPVNPNPQPNYTPPQPTPVPQPNYSPPQPAPNPQPNPKPQPTHCGITEGC